MEKSSLVKHLRLKGKAIVYIDWANVHGWEKSLKREIDLRELFKYLKNYQEVKKIKFYFGTDKHPKSKLFLEKVKGIGYWVTTKSVKYILIKVNKKRIYKRKCDFDIEICIDVHKDLEKGIESFIFLTGDGDFESLYKLLIEKRKQVIVVYSSGHLGREVWKVKEGIFKTEIKTLGDIFRK